jgi:hypothetical protein
MTFKETRFNSIYDNHINGNHSISNELLNKLNKADLVDFMVWLASNDKERAVRTWDTGNGKVLRLVTVQ